jgi:hypothetical protein
MIQKIKYLILLLFIVMLTSSCSKWLDLKPQDGIIRQNFWKTKEDVKAAVIGCYSSLFATTQTLFVWGEIRGDMLGTTIKTTSEQLDIINGNILSSNSITSWRVIYQTINYCNTVIDFAPSALTTDKTYKQADLNANLAEAKALRAYMYFVLLKTFGEVPLVVKSTSSDANLVQMAKNTQKEISDQIVADLAFAEKYAPTTYGDKAQDKGRITRYTVNAFQADVFLWIEKYPECIDACNKVILSNQFGLIAGKNPDGSPNSQWYNTVFYNGNSNESIFEFQFDSQALNPFYNLFISSSQQFTGSGIVMDQMYMVDPLNSDNKDIRGDLGSILAGNMMIWKFAGTNNYDPKAVRTATTSYAHWFVYRYSDILLMKAEALAWTTGSGQEALDLVKVIRDRANALPLTAQTPLATDQQAISDYIIAERAREFAFEGKRWYDILRNAKRNNYSNLPFLLEIELNIAPSDKQQFILNKYKDVRSHYLPINLYELQTDKKLVQNPFYQ